MKKTLYKVVKGVWGADRPVNLYFKTKEEADKFYHDSDYVDEPVKVTMSDERASDLLAHTDYFLNN